eukprot:TRINITY_DN14045_c0_g1_i4.p1 TRINITY_DN14045_c0_g1~~TRINITY_DN14045_c0_g1_i4.p1  ORF type:complete len:334 (-),score=27.91 TRINITY_DN14045_c0_g1_i4:91-1092(-)
MKIIMWNLCCVVISLLCWQCGSADPAVSELQKLRKQSRDDVIHFDESMFERLALNPNRKYTLIVFMTAAHLLDKSNLQLRKVRKEFGLAAMAFSKKNQDSLFFCEIEFGESKDIFARLGVQSLPFVFRLSEDHQIGGNGMISIGSGDQMEQKEFRSYPWMGEDFVSFVSDRTGMQAEEIERPSALKSPVFQVFALIVLITGAYIGHKIYYSEWIQNPFIWISACLFVFWFATSGGMYDIIRGVPLMVPTQEGKVQWYTQGQGQLGAEGFTIGTMYIVFAVSLVVFTQLGPRIKDQMVQRVVLYSALVIAYFCFSRVVSFYKFKNGYHWYTYLF